MENNNFLSLDEQIALSERLFGASGPKRVQAWLDEQVSCINDPAFARLFSYHSKSLGIAEQEFNHRHIRSIECSILGGIRFFGGDSNRPFVDVFAHDFKLDAEGIDALIERVADEWQSFKPRNMRLLLTPDQLDSFQKTRHNVVVDSHIHAARYQDMELPDGRVGLEAFQSKNAAIELVEQRYREVAMHDLALAENVTPADPEDLQAWHEEGQIRAITANGETVGLLAIAPGSIVWIEGDEVKEEVTRTDHKGNGFAEEAQKVWAARANDPVCLLLGTIDRLNTASQKTADRTGRKAILHYTFIDL